MNRRCAHRPVLLVAMACAALVVAPPRAQAAKKQNAEAAREHVNDGTAAYNLGHFDEAIAEFEAAYKLVPDAALLFNIAQSHRLAGRSAPALGMYKTYLRTAPRGAEDRKQAEKWRDELERTAASGASGASAASSDRSPAAAVQSPSARAADPFDPVRAAPPPAASEPAPPPAAAAPSPVTNEPESARPASPSASRGKARAPAPSLLEIAVGPRFLARSFTYTPSAMSPSSYHLSFTPVVGGRLSLYPAARVMDSFAAHLGILLALEAATWMRSGVFPTGTSDLVVGVQARLPSIYGQFGISGAFFRHAFILRDSPAPGDQARVSLSFPNTTYVGARLGVEGRLALGDRGVLQAEAAYRLVTNPGEGTGQVRSSTYFPGASVSYAFDAGVSLGLRVLQWCEARIGFDLRRYSFGALQGATLRAPGAADQYMALSLALQGTFAGP